MPLVYGKAISSEEVERIVSRQFTPAKFASLCNAIVWATAGRHCKSLPSFTERVNVKDGGIDAEWTIDLPDDGSAPAPLLGSGWNVFQYKQRDVTAQGRDVTFRNLKDGLKGAIKSLFKATGRRPDKYVIFHNIDVTHFTKGQKSLLKKALLAGYDLSDNVAIEIVGAAEIATFLNDLPHLRLGFFQAEAFLDWQSAWQAHTKEKIFGASDL